MRIGTVIFLCIMVSGSMKAQLLDLAELEDQKTYYSIDQAEREPDKALKLQVLRRAYSFPTSVLRMNKLQYLKMSHTLVEKIPDAIENLESLRVLLLRGNKLTEIPAQIGQLTNLLHLDLSKNKLKQIDTTLSELAQLQILDLSKNPELGSVSFSLENMTDLRSLGLSKLKLTNYPSGFEKGLKMEALDISKNQLSYIHPSIFTFKGLKTLNLSDNPINNQTQISEMIGSLTNLEQLSIAGLKLKDEKLPLSSLSKLTDIDVSMNVFKLIPEELFGLSKMKYINLSANLIDSVSP